MNNNEEKANMGYRKITKKRFIKEFNKLEKYKKISFYYKEVENKKEVHLVGLKLEMVNPINQKFLSFSFGMYPGKTIFHTGEDIAKMNDISDKYINYPGRCIRLYFSVDDKPDEMLVYKFNRVEVEEKEDSCTVFFVNNLHFNGPF